MPRLIRFHSVGALLLLSVSSAPLLAQHSVTYSQSDFPTLDGWTSTIVRQDAGVTYSSAPIATGGNLGSFWQHDLSISAGVEGRGMRSYLLNDGYTWNLQDHLLASLSVSVDVQRISSGFLGSVSGFVAPVIQQNGTVSRAPTPSPIALDSWSTLSWFFTDFSDWNNLEGPPSMLDLSGDGGELQFGFVYSLSTTSCGSTCSAAGSSSGLDNIRFTASAPRTEVPEPTSWALLFAAVPFVLIAQQRRRTRRA